MQWELDQLLSNGWEVIGENTRYQLVTLTNKTGEMVGTYDRTNKTFYAVCRK